MPLGQEDHSGAEHLNFPGRELNVINFTEQYFFKEKPNKLPDKLLNKRSELIARCRHKTKFKL